jgi:Reverse transcriptase (RNA-dependent DNA polymerase)
MLFLRVLFAPEVSENKFGPPCIQEALTEWRRQVSGMGIDINDNNLSTLFFADDQVVVANDEDDLDFMFRKLLDAYQKWGLNINTKKTEYLLVGNDEIDPELQINTDIKKCSEFKYLGSVFSKEGTSKKDICYRTQQGRNSIRILNSLLWSNQIRLSTKMTIYQAIVEPILTYGSECWQLSVKDKRAIETVEMDYLRRACRISMLDHIPNEEIRRRTKRVFTSSDRIESRQLIWYGHVMRMTDDRWPKRVINYVPKNRRRRRGRPTTSWIQGIKHTMADRALKDDDWKNKKIWRSKCGKRQML